MGLDAIDREDLLKGFMSKDRLRPRDTFPRPKLDPLFCTGCHKITNLRECWGCKKWFCYDCLVEHMMGCKEWLKIKGDYDILFECERHEICDDCPYRFKCFTSKKIPKKR